MDLVTPLEVACVAWHGEVVRKMLSVSNVDANLPDKNGQTPMHVAAMNGTVDILVELLKREDIDVNRYVFVLLLHKVRTFSIFYSDSIGNLEQCHSKHPAAYCVTNMDLCP